MKGHNGFADPAEVAPCLVAHVAGSQVCMDQARLNHCLCYNSCGLKSIHVRNCIIPQRIVFCGKGIAWRQIAEIGKG